MEIVQYRSLFNGNLALFEFPDAIAHDSMPIIEAAEAHAKEVLKYNPDFNPFEEVLDYLETRDVHRIHIHSVVISAYL